LSNINKIEAKGATALGPALVTALDIVEKGSPGSSVILCTDGLANIGIGQLEPYDEAKKKFYADLGERAKAKNISVNIITIKGEGCKVEAIGQLA
jgi:Mg-chelatase subunit ChlD